MGVRPHYSIFYHARLLNSPAPTFFDALTAETKPYTREQLFARFEEWLNRGAPAGAGLRQL
jgi:hypothetical protein